MSLSVNSIKFVCLLYLLVCKPIYSFSQLIISPNADPSALANTIVAPGIAVTNVSMNCNQGASATFTANGTNLGISSGIILSTGLAVDAVGPNNSDGSSGGIGGGGKGCFASGTSPNFYDPQLSALEPEANFDGCVLEFDIKPICNVININYVFASEEYPEFVCSDFNDVFGFFISGPNPSGGSYVNRNIAQVPGTNIPVAINSINPGVSGANGNAANCTSLGNAGYYINNNNGNAIQFDGFTVPLVAAANVVPCAVYHIKLAIADAKDCKYDSGVFLTYHGITCPGSQIPIVNSTTTDVKCVSDGAAAVTVSNYTGNITYNWSPGGQTSPSITNLTPGTYTCTINFFQPCPYTQEVKVNIDGKDKLTLTSSSTNAYCNNPTGTTTVLASGGTPPYLNYTWNTVPAQNTSSATQLLPGSYTVTVTDANNCTLTSSVIVGNTNPVLVIKDSVLNATCGELNGKIYIKDVKGGRAPYTYNWNTVPPQTTAAVVGLSPGTYSVDVRDADNCPVSKSYTIINLYNLPTLTNFWPERCLQKNGSATIQVLNGIPTYNYSWSHDASLNNPTATGLAQGQYIITVTDAVGCTAKETVNIINVNDVFDGGIFTDPEDPEVDVPFTLGISTTPLWGLDQVVLPDNGISNSVLNTLNYPNYGYYTATFYVSSVNKCKDTIHYRFFVKDYMTIYFPNAFSPNKDRDNNTWKAYGTLIRSIKIYIFDRWGVQMFTSDSLERGWDGTYNGKPAQQDVYVYKVEVEDLFSKHHQFSGTITLLR